MRAFVRRALACGVGLVLASGLAQATPPGWTLTPDRSAAYVEAFAFPGSIRQADTGLAVVCDERAPSGLNARAWFGVFPGATLPTELEVLVRRDREAPRREPWITDGVDFGTPRYFEEVDRVLDDWRRGGTFALRLFLFAAVPDDQQPTYQFAVDGFAEVEAQLACQAPDDPFADLAADDPFADLAASDPFADAPSPHDPFAAPVAPAPAAPAPAADPFATPTAPTPAPDPFATPSGATTAAPDAAPAPVAWAEAGPAGGEYLAARAGAVTAYLTCDDDDHPIVLLGVISGPAVGRTFTPVLNGATLLELHEELDPGMFVLAIAGSPRLGALAWSIAADEGVMGLDAVFADGSREPLLRARGGGDFWSRTGWIGCLAPWAPVGPDAGGVTSWTTDGDGDDLIIQADGPAAVVFVGCDDLGLPIAALGVDTGLLGDRPFDVTVGDGPPVQATEAIPDLDRLAVADLPWLAVVGLLAAALGDDVIEIAAVFADGARAPLLRAVGGDGYVAAYDQLACSAGAD